MTFTLVVQPDGKSILTTPATVTPRMIESIRDAWQEWRESDVAALLVLSETDVVQIRDVELDVATEQEGAL